MDATKRSLELREKVLSKQKEIERLSKIYGVKNIRIFGSVAKGCADEDSDIDIVVDKDGIRGLFEIAGFKIELDDLLEEEVDVVISTAIKENRVESILEGKLIPVA